MTGATDGNTATRKIEVERLAASGDNGVEGEQDGIADILTLAARSLGAVVVYFSRLAGDVLQVERMVDRTDLDRRPDDVIALCQAYCTALLATAARSLVIEDARTAAPFAALPQTHGIGAHSGVPLYDSHGRLYGTLCALYPQPHRVRAEDIETLTLAGRAVMQAVESATRHARERRAWHDVALSAERLHTLYMAMACGVLILNPAGEIVDANTAAARILGRRLDRLHGQGPGASLWRATSEDGATLREEEWPFTIVSRTRRPQRNTTLVIRRPDGARRWLQVDAVPLLSADNRLDEVVISFIDLTARKRVEDELERHATHDTLTGLPNRTLLLAGVERALQIAKRPRRRGGDPSPLALLVVDLVLFKRVNDMFGHHYGDLVLQEVAARLQATLRTSDTVARLGGDEFAILLPETDGAGAARAAYKILTVLDNPVVMDEHSLDVNGCVGIALYPAHAPDGTALLRRAHMAMNRAGRVGEGFAVYDEAIEGEQAAPRLTLVGAEAP